MHKFARRNPRSISLFLALSAVSALFATGCNPDETTGEVEIDQVSPSTGSPFGGTALTITGSGFKANDKITFDDVPCASLKIVSSTKVECLSPPHAKGAVDVVVTRDEVDVGALEGGFTYKCGTTAAGSLAIWANEGGDKVPQEDARASCDANAVKNSAWDGTTISLFGGRNETVSFNLVIEASDDGADDVSVEFSELVSGANKIKSVPASGDGVFDWTNRKIELFYVQYLKIAGLSQISYEAYDERQIPYRFQRPWSGEGIPLAGTDWSDRPDHDKHYPDIAVPLEAQGSFDIDDSESQSIWADIYIPKGTPTGTYTGYVVVKMGGAEVKSIPVSLKVRNFELPDAPSAKTMVYMGYDDLAKRYFGLDDIFSNPAAGAQLDLIVDRHHQLAHRHKLSLVDKNNTYKTEEIGLDHPRDVWEPRLDGSLFTAARGYAGPGVGVGSGIFSIGIYHSWSWLNGTEADMHAHTDAWESWFENHSSSQVADTHRALFMLDEVSGDAQYGQIRTYLDWIKSNPGPGGDLKTMITAPVVEASTKNLGGADGIDIIASLIAVGDKNAWPSAVGSHKGSNANAEFWLYNGKRPASGSFAIEDDGTALRELAWGQFKHGVDRWFYWESTYYNSFQGGGGQTNLFQNAQTFGGGSIADPIVGRVTTSGLPIGNGDGVLFYPGTDQYFTDYSRGLNGPIASLRLKHWRRGIQDVDYLTLAKAINKTKVEQIVGEMVPSVLWEPGLTSSNLGSSRVAPSWNPDPAVWEKARKQLADILSPGDAG